MQVTVPLAAVAVSDTLVAADLTTHSSDDAIGGQWWLLVSGPDGHIKMVVIAGGRGSGCDGNRDGVFEADVVGGTSGVVKVGSLKVVLLGGGEGDGEQVGGLAVLC